MSMSRMESIIMGEYDGNPMSRSEAILMGEFDGNPQSRIEELLMNGGVGSSDNVEFATDEEVNQIMDSTFGG